jgi:uncharacterized membrane protein (DUF2068 family)
VDWSLLSCSRRGHTTYAPDEPQLREQLSAQTAGGEGWRCLRCGTFVAGPPDAGGPADQAPVVARGKEIRSRLILRVFALERFVRALIFAGASVFLWRFRSSHTSIEQAFNRELPVIRSLFRQLGFNIDHSKLVGLLKHALTLSSHAITLLAVGAALYAVIEVVEGVGLWQARRWGEYFAMVATSLGLPLEIYDLSRQVTVTALVLLAVNLALVVYLAVTKRLFGIRGGKRAYDARLREESVLEAAAEAAARQSPEAAAGTAGPAPAESDGATSPESRPTSDGATSPESRPTSDGATSPESRPTSDGATDPGSGPALPEAYGARPDGHPTATPPGER